jgi:Fe-S cluster biogenesis protein NfuA
MTAHSELQRQLGNVEELLGKVESAADPSLRATVRELMEVVMNLHGAGLERTLEIIRATGGLGETVTRNLAGDELVGSLLVLYGLHPWDVETRVTRAIEKVASRLRTHGGEVELLGVEDGVARLRLKAKGHGCGSTAQALTEVVEDAVYCAAPDLTSLTIEVPEEKQGFVPVEALLNQQPVPAGKGAL